MEEKYKKTYEKDPIKEAFYHSARWKDCARSYCETKSWICERCANKNIDNDRPLKGQLQVHHKNPITLQNIGNPEIALNHDNLELLCIKCHNKERAADNPTCQSGLKLVNGRLERITEDEHNQNSNR